MADLNVKSLTFQKGGNTYNFTPAPPDVATQSADGLMSSTDKTKLDSLGVISTDIDITVPVSGWQYSVEYQSGVLVREGYMYIWSNSNVKENSDVQVFFRTGSEDSVLEYIEYAKVTGGVQLKTNRLAEADLPLTIRILDMEQNTGNSINASAVSTSAISGFDTVEEVLDELADRTEVFTGATMSSAGEAGIVPAPDQRGYGTAPGKFLSDDGTWKNLYDEIGLSKATSVAYGPITKEMLSFKTTNRKSENQQYTMGQIKLDASDKAQFSFREVSKNSSTGLNNGVSETYNLPAADDDLAAAKSYDILTTKNANGSVIPVSSTDNTTIASAVSTLNNNLTKKAKPTVTFNSNGIVDISSYATINNFVSAYCVDPQSIYVVPFVYASAMYLKANSQTDHSKYTGSASVVIVTA